MGVNPIRDRGALVVSRKASNHNGSWYISSSELGVNECSSWSLELKLIETLNYRIPTELIHT